MYCIDTTRPVTLQAATRSQYDSIHLFDGELIPSLAPRAFYSFHRHSRGTYPIPSDSNLTPRCRPSILAFKFDPVFLFCALSRFPFSFSFLLGNCCSCDGEHSNCKTASDLRKALLDSGICEDLTCSLLLLTVTAKSSQ